MTHFATTLTNIRRSPYQSVVAILLVTITCFVGYCFSLFLWGSQQILHYFEIQPQVTAFFALDAPTETIESVTNKYKQMPGVRDVTLVSKEEGLQAYRKDIQKSPLLLELVTADMLPATLGISTDDAALLPQIKTELEKTNGIVHVMFQQDLSAALLRWTTGIRYAGAESVFLLTVSTFGVIVVITGMKVAIRKRSIYIMRILGATRWYIKAPFVYEGVCYGLTGSVLGWGLMYIRYLYLYPSLSEFLGHIPLLPISPLFFAIQAAIGTVVAMLLGAFASSFATARMMRRAG